MSQEITAGQADTVTYDSLDVSNTALTDAAGATLAIYLKATKGAKSGDWWTGSSWSGTKASCGNATHSDGAQWEILISADAAVLNYEYALTGEHSSGNNIIYSEEVKVVAGSTTTSTSVVTPLAMPEATGDTPTLAQQLLNVQTAIAHAELYGQSASDDGSSLQRAELGRLYARERELLNRIHLQDNGGISVAEY